LLEAMTSFCMVGLSFTLGAKDYDERKN